MKREGNFNSSGKMARLSLIPVALALMGLGFGALQAQVQTFTCDAPGFGLVQPGAVFAAPMPVLLPPILLAALNTVPNPVIPPDPVTGLPTIRPDLAGYIVNLPAAIQLGKALFWDMQAGSDNKVACATCHFKAGADGRTKNQLNPGANGSWDGYSANYSLVSSVFPFTAGGSDVDNIAGSQGVRKSTFVGVSKTGVESTTSVSDSVFNVGGVNVRRVTGKNTPSVINAVFNHRQFWNGRAQPDFNGVNPFGSRDTSARVWTLDYRGNPVQIFINIQNASLASQAVGPPLNDVEMSAGGRTFPDLGHKMMLVKALGLQVVSQTDSVLGPIAASTTGLTTSYKSLIQTAFQPQWWNSNKTVTLANGKSYTMMEANFSLFWGLSIMLYEATLISDQTPMDQYLATRVVSTDPTTRISWVSGDDPTKLNSVVARLQSDLSGLTVNDILAGLALFELPLPLPVVGGPVPKPFPFPNLTAGTTNPLTGLPFPSTAAYNPSLVTTNGVACSACHFPGELTSATVRNLTGPGVELADAVLKAAGFDLRMERMFLTFPAVPLGTGQIMFDPSTYAVNVTGTYVGGILTPVSPSLSAKVATYDAGWYNIGVRPTADDPGLGGTDPFGNYLSWTRLFQTTLLDPSTVKVPGAALPCQLAGGVQVGNVNFPFEVVNLAGFPLLSGSLTKTEPTDVAGTFKTPGLRNVEVTGPYFHNGGKSTLEQVVTFYDGAGNFPNDTKAPAIVPLNLTADEHKALVAFLLSFTDERVRWQQAPFDHPQLFVPDGAPDTSPSTDNMKEIAAVGAAGSTTPLQRFLSLNPFSP